MEPRPWDVVGRGVSGAWNFLAGLYCYWMNEMSQFFFPKLIHSLDEGTGYTEKAFL